MVGRSGKHPMRFTRPTIHFWINARYLSPPPPRARPPRLDPHIATCAPFLGVAEDAIHTIAVEYQEFGDERHARSLAEAEAKVRALAAALARPLALVA
jgi:hypothetical protein